MKNSKSEIRNKFKVQIQKSGYGRIPDLPTSAQPCSPLMPIDPETNPPSDKQTLSFLLRRFQQAGIEPRTDLGQNFMIDMNLQRVLLETAQIGPDDVVLEVGTGTGGLTGRWPPWRPRW